MLHAEKILQRKNKRVHAEKILQEQESACRKTCKKNKRAQFAIDLERYSKKS